MSRNNSVTNSNEESSKSVTGKLLEMANAAAKDIGIIPSKQLENLNAALDSKDAFQTFEAKQKSQAELLRGTVLYVKGDVGLTLENYGIGRSFRATLSLIAAHGERADYPAEIPIQMPSGFNQGWLSISTAGTLQNLRPGYVASWTNRLQEALAGVEIWRIGCCPRCSRLFWKARKKQSTCGKVCKMVRWREENKERWEEISNRAEEKRFQKREAARKEKEREERARLATIGIREKKNRRVARPPGGKSPGKRS